MIDRLSHALQFAKKSYSGRKYDRSAFVYLVHCDGFHKVGIANNLKVRLNGIQVSNPHPVNVVRLWRCRHALNEERRIHHMLASKGFHVRGEWFKIPNPVLLDLIDSMRHREC